MLQDVMAQSRILRSPWIPKQDMCGTNEKLRNTTLHGFLKHKDRNSQKSKNLKTLSVNWYFKVSPIRTGIFSWSDATSRWTPVVGTLTETLGLHRPVNAPQTRNILSIQSSLALCSCLLPELCPQWGSYSLTPHISLSPSHPWPLLTTLSAFLALSSLLIYRIMHQTSSRGDTVTQAAAPSAITLILTTVSDRLGSHRHCFQTLKRRGHIQHAASRILTAVSQTLTGLLRGLQISNAPAVDVTLPQLPPSWKQTAKDTKCCVGCEITRLVSTCSNTHADTWAGRDTHEGDWFETQLRISSSWNINTPNLK